MRVIAGTARRLNLKTIEGKDTRPTTDRIKETLFNILNDELFGCVFVDLFSGSGGIGIEALSRGAKCAYFVDNNKKAIECINYNLEFTHLKDKAYVMASDVIIALGRIKSEETFDIVFLDPPYNGGFEEKVLRELSNNKLVSEDTLIIVEALKDTEFGFVSECDLEVVRVKEYKTNKHVFIQRKV